MNPDDPTDPDDARRLRAALALRDAPAAWVRAAEALWPEHGLGLAGAVRRVVAALRFDSATASPALAGVRSSAPGAARHLLFSAEGRDIDLRIAPAGEAWLLVGQILGPDEAGRIDVVSTAADRPVVGRAELNALGEFRIDDVAAGRYRIVLNLGDDAIELPEVDVGDGAR
ncbi:MAG: hypothetical protein JSR59_17635 [Proteobacteria bacterium]|nr:hypothetical protein [Pseudomonadota bacterium]